ncbi:MAG TPA: hypothetical protein VIY70_10955 [Acidimicrobiia bacterium]
MTTESPTSLVRAGRPRRFALSVVLWAFGLSASTLLVGVWGRAVASSEQTLSTTARAAVDASMASERIQGWIMSEIDDLEGVDPATVEPAVSEVVGAPETALALDALITQVVGAALAPPASTVQIDATTALRPLAPLISQQFAERGVAVTDAEVGIVLDRLGALVVSTEDELGITDAVARGRAALTVVVVAATLALAATAALALALADDRIAMVRSLAIRLTVAAATFAAFLRIGAWAVDPFGGRSPVIRAGVVVLSSNTGILAAIGGASAGVAIVAAVTIRSRRFTRDSTRSLENHEPLPGAESGARSTTSGSSPVSPGESALSG